MTAATLPDATVVVPSYRSAATLGACIDAVCGQRYPGRFQVLVVHTGEEPAEPSVAAAHPEVRWHVVGQRWLPGQARNWALDEVDTDIVAFLDSDCIAAPDWLATLVRDSDDHGFDAAGGAVITDTAPVRSWAMHLLEFGEWLPWGRTRPCRDFCSSGAIYRRSSLDGRRFPDAFYPCEETVLNHDLHVAGARLGFVPGAVVHHIHRRSARQVLRYCVTSGATYRKSVDEHGLRGRGLVRAGRIPAFVLATGVRAVRPIRDGFRLGLRTGWRTILSTPLVIAGAMAWALGFVRGGAAIAASSVRVVDTVAEAA